MNNIQILDIGQVAKQSGLPASTLRYYEEKGLVQSIGRRGLRRLFAANIVQQLALISLGRQAGFSLDDIAQMFAIDGKPQIDRAQLLLKADELDKIINSLSPCAMGLFTRRNAKPPAI